MALINSLCDAPGGGSGTDSGLFNPATETGSKKNMLVLCAVTHS